MHHHHRQKTLNNFGSPFLEIIADVNGLIGGIALYPQIVKAYNEQTVEGLSVATLIILTANSLIWLYYGIKKRITPLKISTSLNVLASGILLLFAFLFR